MRRLFLLVLLVGCAPIVPLRAEPFRLSSPDFTDGGPMPPKCSLHGDNIAPTLEITGVPKGTRSLLLIVDDPDAPAGLWTHWVVWNITAGTTSIPGGKLPAGAKQGRNSNGNVRYDGPKPPSGTHHYHFRLSALSGAGSDALKTLPEGSSRSSVEAALDPHRGGNAFLAQTELIGTFTAKP
jgi:Raf kinase inhibitor-like YbhB/YbcL family protein